MVHYNEILFDAYRRFKYENINGLIDVCFPNNGKFEGYVDGSNNFLCVILEWCVFDGSKNGKCEESVLVSYLEFSDVLVLGFKIGSIIDTEYEIKFDITESTDMGFLISSYEVFKDGSLRSRV